MFYDVGSLSNRNIQLLYEYRILRQPSESITAICRNGEKQSVSGLEWTVSEREVEGYSEVYEARLGIDVVAESVPFLEFHPKDGVDWRGIADFIDVEVADDVIIYSSSNQLTDLEVDVYWCYSLRHIASMLEDILTNLSALITDYDKLEEELTNFKDTGVFQQRPDGLVPNLVKLVENDNSMSIKDTLFRIMTADSNRLFVDLSQDNLNVLERIFNETVEFRFLIPERHLLDGFNCPIILISGTGDLVLRNIRGQVIITEWTGTITLMDCPEVHIAATDNTKICNITYLLVSKNSTVYLENYVHYIDVLELYANSLCRHWRANVRNLRYVGPGCTYWCSAQVSIPGRIQLAQYLPESNTVFDFKMHNIIGTFCSDFNDMLIVAQKNLTPRIGNYDAEPSPSIYVPRWSAEY